jgi:3-deoxy-D-manno-octulosonic-acid transferase
VISPSLACYRGAATLAGLASPLLRGFGAPGSAWREAFSGSTADMELAAGGVWVHAASLGEVVAARIWIRALLAAGQRSPLLLTTRTARGRTRARAELGDEVVVRIAPLDVPQLLRSFLRAAAPWRLDVIETEIWPHLIQESRRAGVAVVFASATVSDRSRARLRRWGVAGPGLFGEGVWVLAQSDRHAERFHSLGVPSERIAVTGDLKAEPPVPGASRDPATRSAVVFGSLRPGEHDAVPPLARSLSVAGRSLVVAPRHEEGRARVMAALQRDGAAVSTRDPEDSPRATVTEWIAGLPAGAVGVLGTQGELPEAYESAAVAIVGGTFAPYGGHNALEPAARGCPVLVGPHTEGIEEGLAILAREGALARAASAPEAVAMTVALLGDPARLQAMGEGARRAASSASGAPRRSLEAIDRFGLAP